MAIVAEGTLANIVLTPTLQDQVIAAQKDNIGTEKIRQRLRENDSCGMLPFRWRGCFMV